MRKIGLVMLILAVLVIASSPALAQPPGGRGGGGFGASNAMLLGQKSVQDELKLTEDQLAKVKTFQENQRNAFQGFQDLSREERAQKMQELAKANEKAIGDILQPEQHKRLKQIGWQRAGAGAINNPEVVTALGLNDEQKQKLEAIQKDGQRAMRELFGQGGGKPDEEARKKMQEFRKGQDDKVMNVLTAEQKTKFKDLLGPEFKGEIRFGKPGGN